MSSPPLLDEQVFRQTVTAVLKDLFRQLDAVDSDDLDTRVSDGVLQVDFEGGGVFVLSPQVPVRELWLSAMSRAWHFKFDPESGVWTERDTAEPLETVLTALFTKRLGKPTTIAQPRLSSRCRNPPPWGEGAPKGRERGRAGSVGTRTPLSPPLPALRATLPP
jgi:iron donor protein CyaY